MTGTADSEKLECYFYKDNDPNSTKYDFTKAVTNTKIVYGRNQPFMCVEITVSRYVYDSADLACPKPVQNSSIIHITTYGGHFELLFTQSTNTSTEYYTFYCYSKMYLLKKKTLKDLIGTITWNGNTDSYNNNQLKITTPYGSKTYSHATLYKVAKMGARVTVEGSTQEVPSAKYVDNFEMGSYCNLNICVTKGMKFSALSETGTFRVVVPIYQDTTIPRPAWSSALDPWSIQFTKDSHNSIDFTSVDDTTVYASLLFTYHMAIDKSTYEELIKDSSGISKIDSAPSTIQATEGNIYQSATYSSAPMGILRCEGVEYITGNPSAIFGWMCNKVGGYSGSSLTISTGYATSTDNYTAHYGKFEYTSEALKNTDMLILSSWGCPRISPSNNCYDTVSAIAAYTNRWAFFYDRPYLIPYGVNSALTDKLVLSYSSSGEGTQSKFNDTSLQLMGEVTYLDQGSTYLTTEQTVSSSSQSVSVKCSDASTTISGTPIEIKLSTDDDVKPRTWILQSLALHQLQRTFVPGDTFSFVVSEKSSSNGAEPTYTALMLDTGLPVPSSENKGIYYVNTNINDNNLYLSTGTGFTTVTPVKDNSCRIYSSYRVWDYVYDGTDWVIDVPINIDKRNEVIPISTVLKEVEDKRANVTMSGIPLSYVMVTYPECETTYMFGAPQFQDTEQAISALQTSASNAVTTTSVSNDINSSNYTKISLGKLETTDESSEEDLTGYSGIVIEKNDSNGTASITGYSGGKRQIKFNSDGSVSCGIVTTTRFGENIEAGDSVIMDRDGFRTRSWHEYDQSSTQYQYSSGYWTEETSIGTDGKIVAGAGAVKLDSNGLKTYDADNVEQCSVGTDGKFTASNYTLSSSGLMYKDKKIISTVGDTDMIVMAVDATKVTGILEAAYLSAGRITAGKIESTEIEVSAAIVKGTLEAATISASNIKGGKIDASEITVTNIDAGNITSGTIGADKVTVEAAAVSGKLSAATIAAKDIDVGKLKAGVILSSNISAKQIASDFISSDVINSDSIAAGVISADKITSGKFSGKDLSVDAAIVNGSLIAATISGDRITGKLITADKIKAETITGNEIAGKTITADNIATGTITSDQIKAKAITTDKLAGGNISAVQFQLTETGAIQIGSADSDMLALTTNGLEISNMGVRSTVISKTGNMVLGNESSKTAIALTPTSAGSGRISFYNTTGATINTDGTISNGTELTYIDSEGIHKIANQTVTEGSIVSYAVTTEKLKDAAVETSKIKDEAVTDAKIQSITANKITAGEISSEVAYLGSVGANQIRTGTLQADTNIQVGSNTHITGSGLYTTDSGGAVVCAVESDGNISGVKVKANNVLAGQLDVQSWVGDEYIGTGSVKITANGLTTYSGNGNEVQCSIGTDGVITAGQGAVSIDNNGITTYDRLAKGGLISSSTGEMEINGITLVDIDNSPKVELSEYSVSDGTLPSVAQCYIGTDGAISVGSGSVILDREGLKTYGYDHAIGVNCSNLKMGGTQYPGVATVNTVYTVQGNATIVPYSIYSQGSELLYKAQCTIDTNGIISAGGGAIQISSQGLSTYSDALHLIPQCHIGTDGVMYAGEDSISIGHNGVLAKDKWGDVAYALNNEGLLYRGRPIINSTTGRVELDVDAARVKGNISAVSITLPNIQLDNQGLRTFSHYYYDTDSKKYLYYKGDLQCAVGTNGVITAGAGAVKLDAGGISTYSGAIAKGTVGDYDYSNATKQCSIGTDGVITAGEGVVRLSSSGLNVGASSSTSAVAMTLSSGSYINVLDKSGLGISTHIGADNVQIATSLTVSEDASFTKDLYIGENQHSLSQGTLNLSVTNGTTTISDSYSTLVSNPNSDYVLRGVSGAFPCTIKALIGSLWMQWILTHKNTSGYVKRSGRVTNVTYTRGTSTYDVTADGSDQAVGSDDSLVDDWFFGNSTISGSTEIDTGTNSSYLSITTDTSTQEVNWPTFSINTLRGSDGFDVGGTFLTGPNATTIDKLASVLVIDIPISWTASTSGELNETFEISIEYTPAYAYYTYTISSKDWAGTYTDLSVATYSTQVTMTVAEGGTTAHLKLPITLQKQLSADGKSILVVGAYPRLLRAIRFTSKYSLAHTINIHSPKIGSKSTTYPNGAIIQSAVGAYTNTLVPTINTDNKIGTIAYGMSPIANTNYVDTAVNTYSASGVLGRKRIQFIQGDGSATPTGGQDGDIVFFYE